MGGGVKIVFSFAINCEFSSLDSSKLLISEKYHGFSDCNAFKNALIGK
jgi:hypothetical protein